MKDIRDYGDQIFQSYIKKEGWHNLTKYHLFSFMRENDTYGFGINQTRREAERQILMNEIRSAESIEDIKRVIIDVLNF
jgi:hypothetical protein